MIRAESSSHSVLLLAIAATIHFLLAVTRRPRMSFAWAVVCASLAFLCANARDTYGYFLLLLVGVVLVGLWWARAFVRRTSQRFATDRRRWRHTALASAALVVLSLVGSTLFAQWSAKRSLRYDFSLMNVIFRRVLPVAEKRAYFVAELGMPMSRALMSRRRKWASHGHRYAFRAPELQEFRDWLASKGREGYERYLLTHPGLTWTEAYAAYPAVLRYRREKGVASTATRLSAWVDSFVADGPLSESPGIFSALAAALGFGALSRKRYRTRLAGLLTLTFVAGAVTQLYICFHADAMEVLRHSLVASLLLRLSLVIAGGLLLAWTVSLSKRLLAVARRSRTTRTPPCARDPDLRAPA